MPAVRSAPSPLIRVERIALQGPGVVVLTGPSSCGKGEVADALCRLLSIDPERHLSMGEILRSTVERAANDAAFARVLEEKHALSARVSVFDCIDTSEELTRKVKRHLPSLERYLGRLPSRFVSEEVAGEPSVSQLDWLRFCTDRGLLIPDRWTQELIGAAIEGVLAGGPEQRRPPLILDGYPRTVAAARHLLDLLRGLDVPILKVLHLSISRAEMIQRAGRRGRADDDPEALRRRFEFYVENVQPTVDHLKEELGGDRVALIDAHQPAWALEGGERVLDLERSIGNVVETALRALGVPGVIVRDLMTRGREERADG